MRSETQKGVRRRRAARAGGFALVKRLLKPLPVVGSAISLGSAGYEMKKKGAALGALSVTLDLLPIVGTAKTVIEIFTGDLIPDKRTTTGKIQTAAGGGGR